MTGEGGLYESFTPEPCMDGVWPELTEADVSSTLPDSSWDATAETHAYDEGLNDTL